MIDVDARDASGGAISLVTSDHDAHVAEAMLIASLPRQDVDAGELGSDDEGAASRVADLLSGEVLRQMYELIRDGSRDDLLDLVLLLDQGRVPGPLVKSWNLTELESNQWRVLLADDDVFWALEYWVQNHLMLTELTTSASEGVRVLKYRIVDPIQPDVLGAWSAAQNGLSPLPMLLEIGSADRRTRSHLRFKPPKDLLVSSARLQDLDTQEIVAVDQALVTPEIVAIYVRDLPPGNYGLQMDLNVRRTAFVVPALLSSGFTLLLLASGTWLQLHDGRFSTDSGDGPQGTPDAAVTILSLVPTFLILLVLRAGEHPLVTRLLLLQRIGLGISGALSVLVGAAVAADVSPGVLLFAFVTATVASFAATLTLTAVFLRTSHNWRRWIASLKRFFQPLLVAIEDEKRLWRTTVDWGVPTKPDVLRTR